MMQWLAIFAGGFLGSAHCLGMCGGFAAALGSVDRPFWPVFGRQLIYNAGRIFTYAFLGALAGSSGLYLSRFHIGPLDVQQAFSMLAGGLMLLIGLSSLGWVRPPRRIAPALSGLLTPLFTHFLNARGGIGFFTAGLANGFLPCGLVYSFLALAAARSTVGGGMLTMFAFGIGTVPAMLAVGCGTSLIGHVTRRRVFRAAAVVVILLGGVTIWRAWPRAAGNACCCDESASVSLSK